MHKQQLENNFKELSKLRPPFLAKLRLRFRLWRHFVQIKKMQGNVFWRFSKAIFATSLAILVLTSASLTTIYAYRNDNITAFDILYPLKQTVESWAVSAAQSPVEKAELYLDLATKRSIEVQKQLQLKQKIDPNTVVAIKDNNAKAVNAAQQITDQGQRKNIEQKIVASTHTQVDTLKQIKADGIKIEAIAKDIQLEPIVTQDISLGAPNIDVNKNDSSEEIKLSTTSASFQTIVAASPELSLVDDVLSDTKKYTDEKVVAAQLNGGSTTETANTASGTTVLDPPLASVSLSSNLP